MFERGTAHLCVSLLSLAAAVYVTVAWLTNRPDDDFGTLAVIGWLAFVAGLLYSMSNAVAEARRARWLARSCEDRRGAAFALAAQVAVLAAMTWPAWKGPESRAFLVGLGPLLAACGTIACVSLIVAVWDRLAQPNGGSPRPPELREIAPPKKLRWSIAERAPAFLLAALLIALEAAPLPSPPAERSGEHGSSATVGRVRQVVD